MHPKRLTSVVLGLVLIAVGFYVAASILSYDPHEGPFPDYPRNEKTASMCGAAGSYVASYALVLLGWTSLAVAIVVVVAGAFLLGGGRPPGLARKAAGVLMGLLAITIALGLPCIAGGPSGDGSWFPAGPSSGVLGMLLARWLCGQVGWMGVLAVMAVLGSVSAVLLAVGPLLGLLGALRRRRARPAPTAIEQPAAKRAPSSAGAAAAPSVGAQREEGEGRAGGAAGPEPAPVEMIPEDAGPHPPESGPEIVGRAVRRAGPETAPGAARRKQDAAPAYRTGEFQLPPLELLDSFDDQVLEEDEKDIRHKGQVLERTLRDFNIEAKVVRVQRGPVITMFEMALAAGTKVSRVEALGADLAIALKAPNVRTVAPIPGKSTIGIEVPNAQREIVTLRELLEGAGETTAGMAIPLFLGKDTAGNPLIVDLAMAPHLLLAGATGSGKSVAINSIICSILMTRTPDEVQLLLVDPKGVEFSDYARLPHLICPILTDMKRAAAVLQWACKQMDERYALLASIGVRDIASYNQLGRDEVIRRINPEDDAEVDDVPFYLPHIVIVVDELGELMLVAAKEVESSVIRLSQKARAVGIHLVCATQRPSADVITGLIKANLPARVAFHVSSMVDSRTILDRNGAELLLGRGDLLMLPPGSSRLVRAQGTYVSPVETERIVRHLAFQGEPQFRSELREYGTDAGEAWGDELYDEAARIVLETQRGSVSLLQRRLSIGYTRAARLIDMMAEAGIVGSYRGSQARDVLLTLEEWEAARQKAK